MHSLLSIGLVFFGTIVANVFLEETSEAQRPNVVLIVADDMGSNDVSYRGSNQFTTPNIDALGYNGVILNRHYTEAICTPSRASLLTGQYPIRLGMQGTPLVAGEDRNLPRDLTTLPQHLKNLGYTTHLVGKWHLGYSTRNDTPTHKGFDTHFGYWNGWVGYYDYKIPSSPDPEKVFDGFDLKEKFRDAWEYQGKYATDLFTEKAVEVIEKYDGTKPMFLMVTHLAVHTGSNGEVEVKSEKEMNETLAHIVDYNRRKYAAALLDLDTSVGKIVEKLGERNLLENTVIIFMSDNGAQINGQYHNEGSNYPLRGEKLSLHEGGVRNAAVLFSPLLKQKNYIHDQLIHISDWLPTIYSLAGGDVSSLKELDGLDQWHSISENKKGPRRELLVNIDEVRICSAIIAKDGKLKLMNGTMLSGFFDSFGPLPDSGDTTKPDYDIAAILNSKVNEALVKSRAVSQTLNEKIVAELRKIASRTRENTKCNDMDKRKNVTICNEFCLFDLDEDPCETENVIDDERMKEIVEELKTKLGKFWNDLRPQTNKPVDYASDPAKYNGTWCTWKDDQFCVHTPR